MLMAEEAAPREGAGLAKEGEAGPVASVCMSVCGLLTEKFLRGPECPPTVLSTLRVLTPCVPFSTPGRFGATPLPQAPHQCVCGDRNRTGSSRNNQGVFLPKR